MNASLSRILFGCLFLSLCFSPAFAAGKKNKGQKDPTVAIKKKLAAADLPADALAKAIKSWTTMVPS